MAGLSERIAFLMQANGSQAISEFRKVGKAADQTLGDIEQKTKGKGFAAGVTAGLDKLVARSPLAASALDKVGLSTQQLGAMALPALATGAGLAGGALVAFGAKSVDAFQKTALQAGKFADATGLSVESASKYIEVADDIGVSASTIQSAFVKMQKAIDSNRGAFGDLIATTSTGATDLDATFLNVISHLQGIKDPIERANESSKLFGRGFAEVAEIIGTDATVLKQKIDDVSDAQIIDKEELARAREYRDAMDELGDAFHKISLEAGKALVPALTDTANMLTDIVNISNSVSGAGGGLLGELLGAAENVLNPIEGLRESWDTLFGGDGTEKADQVAEAAFKLSQNFASAHGGAAGYANAIASANVANSTMMTSTELVNASIVEQGNAIRTANDALREHTSLQLAAIDSGFAVTAAQNSFTAAVQAANEATDDSKTAVNEQQMAYDAATQAAIATAAATVEYAKKQEEARGSTLSAKEEQQLLIGTLMTLASQASGPVATAIGVVITKLQTLDKTNAEPDITVNDRATTPLREIDGWVNALDGKSATIRVNALTGGAINSLNNVLDAFQRLPKNFTGGIPEDRQGASGFQNFQGGLALVGEKGPELVNLPRGADVFTAAETQAFMSGPSSVLPSMPSTYSSGGGDNIFNITTLDPISAAREVKKVLSAGTRVGVS